MAWKKMEQYDTDQRLYEHTTWQMIVEAFEAVGKPMTKAKAKKFLREGFSNDEAWRNDIYNVSVNRKMNHSFGLEITELSITRHDKQAIHDWRHFQLIKNDVLGENVEAIELYPREERLMDTANTYWLYAFPVNVIFPLGFTERNVSGQGEATRLGATQREFEESI